MLEYLAYFCGLLALLFLLDLWPFLPPYADLRQWPGPGDY